LQSDGVELAIADWPEGEPLRDILDRERPRRRNLVHFARQIAGALAKAHAAGFVHGPLDPAGIFISPKRQVTILTFGSASIHPAPASEADRKAMFGEAVYYTSPEQITGAAPDARSDIFSFGALLYHMTAGRRPFRRATIGETWKTIVEEEPTPVTQVTSRTPPGMDKLVERCLRKNPQRRFQHVSEIEPLLEKMSEVYEQNPNQQASSLSRNRGRIARIAGIALAAAAAVAAVSGTVIWWHGAPSGDPVIGKQLRQLTKDAGYDTDPALSPDGTLLAYASDRDGDGNLDIWVRPTGGGEPRRVTSDPGDDREPAFAPDGSSIAFHSERNGGGVYVVPAAGGEARLLAPDGHRPRYSPDGRSIAYWVGPPGLTPKGEGAYKIFVIPATGGAPRQIRPDFASATYPVWSPDGASLLFLGRPDATSTELNSIEWWVASVDGAKLQNTGACRLFHAQGALPDTEFGIPGEWRGGHIYFSVAASQTSNVWRAGIAGGIVSAAPVRITTGTNLDVFPSADQKGIVAFGRQIFNTDIWGIPVAANDGKVTGGLKRWTLNSSIDTAPSLSTDGAKLLFRSNRTGRSSPWLLEAGSGKESAVTAAQQDQLSPVISPDGSKVAYSESRIRHYEHFYKPLDGGSTEVLCENCGPAISGWSKDSKAVLVDFISGGRGRLSVGSIDIATRAKTILLQDPRLDLHQASVSPDGRFIAFAALSENGSRLYVTPLSGHPPYPVERWIPLTDGTTWDTTPQWSPGGRLVYFGSARDGHRCVWAQRLDDSGRPSGAAFAVYHFHTVRRSLPQVAFGSMDLFVGRDQILVSIGELTGNIWSARVSD